MENISTPWTFFLSLDFPYEHSERLPTIFFYSLLASTSRIMNAKKLKIQEGRQEPRKTSST